MLPLPKSYASVVRAVCDAKAKKERDDQHALQLAKELFPTVPTPDLQKFLFNATYVFPAASLFTRKKPYACIHDVHDVDDDKSQINFLLRMLWSGLFLGPFDDLPNDQVDEQEIRSLVCLVRAFARNGMQGYRLQRAFVTSAARYPSLCIAILRVSKLGHVFQPPLDIHAPFQHGTALYFATLNVHLPLIKLLLEYGGRPDAKVNTKPSISTFCERTKTKGSWASRVEQKDEILSENYVLRHERETQWTHSFHRPCDHLMFHRSHLPSIEMDSYYKSKNPDSFCSPIGLLYSGAALHIRERYFTALLTLLSVSDENTGDLDHEILKSDFFHHDEMGTVKCIFRTTHRQQLCIQFMEWYQSTLRDYWHQKIVAQWKQVVKVLQTLRNKTLFHRSETAKYVAALSTKNIRPLTDLIQSYAFDVLPPITLDIPFDLSTQITPYKRTYVFVDDCVC